MPWPAIHVHLPITVRVRGAPSDEQLSELAAAVRRIVAQRIAEADRRVATYLGGVGEDSAAGGATIGDVQAIRRRAPARPGPQEAHIPGRGWRVLRSVTITIPLGLFMDLWQLQTGRPVAGRPLYADYEREPARVSVWLIQTETTTTMGRLARTAGLRARELMGFADDRELIYLADPTDRLRRVIAEADDTGQTERLPSLQERNARRVAGSGPETELLHGAWLLWVGAVLPAIDPRSWLDLGALSQHTMPLSQVADCVAPEIFEERFALPWHDYVEIHGALEVRVYLLPARVRVAGQPQAIVFLTEIAYQQRADRPSPEVGLLHVVFDTADPATPRLVAQHGRSWAQTLPALEGAETARVPPSVDPSAPRVPAGTVLTLVAVRLPTDAETLAIVRFRSNAIILADRIREWLTRDLSDLYPSHEFASWLARTFGNPPYTRPAGGTLFEHVLAQLSAQEFTALLVAVGRSRRERLQRELMLQCMPTRFADHLRVVALLEGLLAQSASRRRHTFHDGADGGPVGIDLDQDPDRAVRVGGRDVLGDVTSLYISTSERTTLNPQVHQRVRDALVGVRVEVLGEIASGVLSREITEDEFLRICMERAVPRAGVTGGDFTNVDIERSIRIVDITRRDVERVPSWLVQFVFVERVQGSGEWVDVSAVITESSGDFTARLIYAALGRAGEVYAAMGLAIAVVGGIVIAWEAGIIAALLTLGGGTKVVVASIALSILIYLGQVIFTDKEFTARGFLMAGIEGYLGAVGFRGAAFIAQPLTGAIGTATVRRVWTGIVVEKLTLGTVGGGAGAGLTLFAQDLVRVATGPGGFSSPEQYLRTVSLGAAIGVLGEFTLGPILARLGGAGASTPDRMASLFTQLREAGFRFSDLLAETTAGLSRLHGSLVLFAGDAVTEGLYRAFRTRADEIIAAWGTSVVSRRVLELSGAQFSRQAQDGLRVFLEAAERGDQEAVRRLTTVFARSPQETVHLLEVLATLEPRYAQSLLTGTFTRPDELAQLLAGLSRYTPEQQRGVLRMLAELSQEAGLRAAPPGSGTSQAVLFERQAAAAMQIQARAAQARATQLRRQADSQLDEALRTPDGTRRQDALLEAAAAKERQAADLERLSVELSAGRDPRPSAEAMPAPADLVDDITANLNDLFDQARAGPWIVLSAHRGVTAQESDALTRILFSSRSGNPVVFRVEGGRGTDQSRQYIRIGRDGGVRIDTGAADLNVNVGSFERAVEFMIAHRPGSTLKMFEVDGAWLRNLRDASLPEQGTRARLQEELPDGTFVPLPPQSQRLSDVRGTARTVDTRQAADQLQIDGTLMRELQEFIIPGTGREIRFTATTRTGRQE
jgi:hypothetical protein